MSFLDNLENNLNALERNEQGGLEDARRRDSAKTDERAAAPWAEKLRSGEWTQKLMKQATLAGHQKRVRIGLFWIGSTLRLEALSQRLDLRPTGKGVEAVFLEGTEEKKRVKVDLAGDPAQSRAEARGKLVTGLLDRMEEMMKDSLWLVGGKYSIADIATVPFVKRIDEEIAPDEMAPTRHPRVAAWWKAIQARPAFAVAKIGPFTGPPPT